MTPFEKPRGWGQKFRNAFRGVYCGVAGQNSFWVHIPAALAVVAMGCWLKLSLDQMMILTLCIGAVLVSELFNSALEYLAQAITPEYDERIPV